MYLIYYFQFYYFLDKKQNWSQKQLKKLKIIFYTQTSFIAKIFKKFTFGRNNHFRFIIIV